MSMWAYLCSHISGKWTQTKPNFQFMWLWFVTLVALHILFTSSFVDDCMFAHYDPSLDEIRSSIKSDLQGAVPPGLGVV